MKRYYRDSVYIQVQFKLMDWGLFVDNTNKSFSNRFNEIWKEEVNVRPVLSRLFSEFKVYSSTMNSPRLTLPSYERPVTQSFINDLNGLLEEEFNFSPEFLN